MIKTTSYDIYGSKPITIKKQIKYVKAYHTDDGIFFELGGTYPIRIAGAPRNLKECEVAKAYLKRMSSPLIEYRYGSIIFGTTLEEAIESDKKSIEQLKIYETN